MRHRYTRARGRVQRPDPYVSALVSAIEAKIASVRRDGVVSMSVGNLKQIVRPPAGGPDGTNAAWFYDRLFRQAVGQSAIASAFTREFGGA